jgi:hypothetical protein
MVDQLYRENMIERNMFALHFTYAGDNMKIVLGGYDQHAVDYYQEKIKNDASLAPINGDGIVWMDSLTRERWEVDLYQVNFGKHHINLLSKNFKIWFNSGSKTI